VEVGVGATVVVNVGVAVGSPLTINGKYMLSPAPQAWVDDKTNKKIVNNAIKDKMIFFVKGYIPFHSSRIGIGATQSQEYFIFFSKNIMIFEFFSFLESIRQF
jgi:hypothetical protein